MQQRVFNSIGFRDCKAWSVFHLQLLRSFKHRKYAFKPRLMKWWEAFTTVMIGIAEFPSTGSQNCLEIACLAQPKLGPLLEHSDQFDWCLATWKILPVPSSFLDKGEFIVLHGCFALLAFSTGARVCAPLQSRKPIARGQSTAVLCRLNPCRWFLPAFG